MTKISLIAAVDENRGLGKDNKLLCHLPADLQHFKSITMGKPIIMGYKTFQSIGKPLPGRLNIVLSRQKREIDGVQVVSSLDTALELADNASEIMIIGGSDLFQQSINKADMIYLTQIHHTFEADVYFPQIDESTWDCISSHYRSCDDKNQFDMTFYHYVRR